MCGAVYIRNTQQKSKKIVDGHFSHVQNILKNGYKLDSFAAHYEQQFKSTTACTELSRNIPFKVVIHISPIGKMKSFTKTN